MLKVEVEKKATLTGHKDCIYTLEQGNAPEVFYSAGGDGMVVRWNLKDPDTGVLAAKVANSVYALCYVPELSWLLVGQNYAGIHVIDLKTGKEIQSAKITTKAIFDIKVYKDEIFVVTEEGTLVIMSLEDLKVLGKIQLSDKSARSLAINEHRSEMTIGFSDNSLRVLDLTNKTVKYVLNGHENSVFSVVYTEDNQYVVSGGRDAHLRVYDMMTYQEVKSIPAHMYAINFIEASPSNLYYASCSMDKSIKLWRASDFKLIKVIDKARYAGHGTSVNRLLWTDFDNLLVSASDDRTISVWDLNFKETL